MIKPFQQLEHVSQRPHVLLDSLSEVPMPETDLICLHNFLSSSPVSFLADIDTPSHAWSQPQLPRMGRWWSRSFSLFPACTFILMCPDQIGPPFEAPFLIFFWGHSAWPTMACLCPSSTRLVLGDEERWCASPSWPFFGDRAGELEHPLIGS